MPLCRDYSLEKAHFHDSCLGIMGNGPNYTLMATLRSISSFHIVGVICMHFYLALIFVKSRSTTFYHGTVILMFDYFFNEWDIWINGSVYRLIHYIAMSVDFSELIFPGYWVTVDCKKNTFQYPVVPHLWKMLFVWFSFDVVSVVLANVLLHLGANENSYTLYNFLSRLFD